MKGFQIIGVVLVRNEDLFIKRVLKNVADFCDRIIVADHLSKDRTGDIVLELCKRYSHIDYHRINYPRTSHEMIQPFAGKKVWLFAVDGDEVYDPAGLSIFRQDLLSGKYDNWWHLFGNVLNCVEIDLGKKKAKGYLAPPCRSMVKLYNFNAIESWDGPCPERLHGGGIVFRPGYNKGLYYDIYKEISWEKAVFRCLHLCFMRRSSQEKIRHGELNIRKNISDINSENIFKRIISSAYQFLGSHSISKWKMEKYMRGELLEKDIQAFFV